jgi:RNA polymerase-interacting CarD/CdnL/TRCF family regulator
MADNAGKFSKGDWIVHLHYGVGQITGIEKKQIGDEKTAYYRAQTENSTFWVPVNELDDTRVRQIASKYRIRKAIKILKDTPEALSDDHNERKRQINEVMGEISLESGARLVRDLSARQASNKLNPSEEKALDQFSQNFILEWSVSMDSEIEKTREKFQELISEIHQKAV